MGDPVLRLPERNIRLELNGCAIALAQGYSCSTQWDIRRVEAFGEGEPAAVLKTPASFRVELTRLLLWGENPGFSLYDLDDFRLAILWPGRRVVYTRCRWVSLGERLDTRGDAGLESAVLTALGRTEERT